MKTWLIAASAIGGIFASDIIRLSAVILKKNMGIDSMPEYIKQDAAIRALLNDSPEQVNYSREDAADCIRYMDAANVAPVRHGRWEKRGQEIYCSECGEESGYTWAGASRYSDYCPNCGAKLDLEENDG